jgi:hypothetical protein
MKNVTLDRTTVLQLDTDGTEVLGRTAQQQHSRSLNSHRRGRSR